MRSTAQRLRWLQWNSGLYCGRVDRNSSDMERARVIRGLRIAVTALSLAACVLLIALWVRSYRYWDYCVCQFSGPYFCGIGSERAILFAGANPVSVPTATPWELKPRLGNKARYTRQPRGLFGFSCNFDPSTGISLSCPHWFLVILSGLFTTLPWIKWRFSLRTLLIATTLVAVGLGIIVVSS
jgi:hypothetical protein